LECQVLAALENDHGLSNLHSHLLLSETSFGRLQLLKETSVAGPDHAVGTLDHVSLLLLLIGSEAPITALAAHRVAARGQHNALGRSRQARQVREKSAYSAELLSFSDLSDFTRYLDTSSVKRRCFFEITWSLITVPPE
ncbi:hypothetical protein PENTCL1PPCAC_27687, partial [Pristionchus entomophagus]